MRGKSNDLPLKDELFLSPVEKYKLYGRLPWVMIINIIIAITTSAQIMIVIGKTTTYTRAEERFFHEQFINQLDSSDIEYSRKAYIYSLNDLKDHVIRSIDNYFNITSISLENLSILEEEIPMEVVYLNSYYDPTKFKKYQKQFSLRQSKFGPFEEDFLNLKDMVKVMKYFYLNYTIRSEVPITYSDKLECFAWEVLQIYNFEQRSHFIVTLDIHWKNCNKKIVSKDIIANSFYWIHGLVLIFSLINIILTSKYLVKNAKIYWHLKSKYSKELAKIPKTSDPKMFKEKKKWDLLNTADKQKLFSIWNIIALAGNVIQFLGALFSFMRNEQMQTITNALISLGCFLAFFNIARYLDYIKEYSTIFNTVRKAIPKVMKYFLGVIPIFLGFIFFGVAIFWRSERFASIPMAVLTLFAIMNGDSIYDITSDLTGVNFFFGQLYTYTFGLLFIAVVMNIFVSIIEESYVKSKISIKNHWIYTYLNIGNKADSSKKEGKNGAIDNKDGNEDGNQNKQGAAASGQDNAGDTNEDTKNFSKIIKEQRKMFGKLKSQNILSDVFDDQEDEEDDKKKDGKGGNELKDGGDSDDSSDFNLEIKDKNLKSKINTSMTLSNKTKNQSFNLDKEYSKYKLKFKKVGKEVEEISDKIFPKKDKDIKHKSHIKEEFKLYVLKQIENIQNYIEEIHFGGTV